MATFTRAWRIAIADDSPAFVAAAAAYIASLPGWELAGTAPHARQALALVQSVRPDVLLLDLGLPAGAGLQMIRRIKAAPGAPVLIAMALFQTPETALEARRAGAEALLGKEAFVSGLTQALAELFPAAAA